MGRRPMVTPFNTPIVKSQLSHIALWADAEEFVMKIRLLMPIAMSLLFFLHGLHPACAETPLEQQDRIIAVCTGPVGELSDWQTVFCIQYLAVQEGLWNTSYPQSSCQACIQQCEGPGGYRQCLRDCSRACGTVEPARESVASGARPRS